MTRLSPTILRTLLAALSLAVLGLACEKTTTPVDVVPPGAPVAALITVSAPSGGMLTVTGQPGAVEGSATVRATNQTSGGDPVMASAGGNGAFSLQLPGGLLDVVRLRAVDEAGNVSTYTDLVSGAPFALAATSGLGQTGVVGSTLAEPLVFTLTDGGGAPVEGVEIVYALETGDGSFDPETVSSGPDGRVSSVLTLGTAAGALSVRPHAVGLTLDSVTPIAATATPGPPVSLVWAEGDGQKDAPGETLLGALRVEAQDSYGNAVAGQALTVVAGQGGSVSPTGGTTDADGGLDCSWTLGGSLGTQQLTASATGLPDGVAQAVADDAPTLTSVNPTTPVDPGDLLTLDGDNFCETEAFNTVLLGATPMTVVAASETHLSVRVPSGVLPGVYALSLSVGHQTAPQTYDVEVVQPLGGVEDHPFVGGAANVQLALPGSSTRYVMIPYNLDYWPAGEPAGWVGPQPDYTYGQDGYGVDAVALARGAAGERADDDPVWDFHRRLLTTRGEGPYTGERVVRDREAPLGDRVAFVCLAVNGNTLDPANYVTVNATLRYTGTHTKIYVDDDTPAAYVPATAINALGAAFDQEDYVTDVAAFGEPSDIDGDGKVTVLLSPVVNGLTTWNDGSYIGGFFNSIDLDIWFNVPGTSNHGEFFYAIVPDPGPNPQFSPVAHEIDATIESLKSIFAHEFQHMISAGQRYILQGDLNSPDEELWFNEGLSHLGEDLCGYTAQNVARVKIYLHGGAHRFWSLVQGPATLAERGASYLFCRYLADRWTGDSFTRSLIGGPEAGPANVAQATGETFEQVFKDWTAAIYLDDRDLDGDGFADDLGPVYRFTSHNIRTDFPYSGGPSEPLAIVQLTADDPAYSSTLAPSAMDYLEIGVAGGQSPPPGGTLDLHFTGAGDGPMGVQIIRIAH
ncbi:MAG: IPT/TIG domain-containing protein [Candidatus Latescibacteria bacterium]|nr:IPT/TIG domain-containing protein [Candidatus Latescibacterota bacterium]